MGAVIIFDVLRALDYRLTFIKRQAAFVIIVRADENNVAFSELPVALSRFQGPSINAALVESDAPLQIIGVAGLHLNVVPRFVSICQSHIQPDAMQVDAVLHVLLTLDIGDLRNFLLKHRFKKRLDVLWPAHDL